jgi:mono/diheme cytochrome c family protein
MEPSGEVAAAPPPLEAKEPQLVIGSPQGEKTFTRAQLLAHPSLQTLTLNDQAGYDKQKLTFEAVPLSTLFEGLSLGEDDTIEYDTLDGFSSILDPKLALNTHKKGAIAYLAVERPENPWPLLGTGEKTAGPFYVIWKNPELSGIGREEWPFQIKSFSIKPSLKKRFPAIFPDSTLPDQHPVRLGFASFVKNCFPCHTLNGQGNSNMGPDLNLPHSPTEYFQEGYLQKLVRDPQSLRTWKGSKMSGFPPEVLSDTELNDLVKYLEHMAGRRPQ